METKEPENKRMKIFVTSNKREEWSLRTSKKLRKFKETCPKSDPTEDEYFLNEYILGLAKCYREKVRETEPTNYLDAVKTAERLEKARLDL